MNILVDITHPAKVHFFRNALRILEDRGHKVIITSRDKDVIVPLLHLYGLKSEVLSKAQRGFFPLAAEILERYIKIFHLVRKHNIDIMLGTLTSIPVVSRLTKAKSLVFATDDAYLLGTFAKVSYALADVVATPAALKTGFGPRHIQYEGYHQLAYLHPDHFTPDPGIHRLLGVTEGEPYFIVRFVGFAAIHDVGHRGPDIETQRRLIKLLAERGRVFISSEKTLPEEFQAYQIQIPLHKMHDAMAYAKMFVGDGQSMAMEAAILGTPSIRCNTFVGKIAVYEEMENKYGLKYGFLPQDGEKMLQKIEELLNQKDLEIIWQQRRAKMLAEKINVANWIASLAESYQKQ